MAGSYLREGDVYRYGAGCGATPEFLAYLMANPITPGRGHDSIAGRVALSGKVECIPEIRDVKNYILPEHLRDQTRSVLGVPLLRDEKVEGVLILARLQPGSFDSRLINLVQTFADQAVIAIANVRLFNEVKARTDELSEALQQQTATADVLKVISRSAFDLQPVLNTLTTSAVTLCGAGNGIYLKKGDAFHIEAATTATPEPEFWSISVERRSGPAEAPSADGFC